MQMQITGQLAELLEKLFTSMSEHPERFSGLASLAAEPLVITEAGVRKVVDVFVDTLADTRIDIDEALIRRVVDEVVDKSARELRYLGASEKIVEYLTVWCAGMEKKFEKRFDRIEAMIRDVRSNTRPASGRVQKNGVREVSEGEKASPKDAKPGPSSETLAA